MLTSILVNRIPVNPLNVETFNFEFDEYPIDEALIDQVCEQLFKTYFSKITQSQPDLNSNSAPV
jgi:predicted HTH transcriptional regulator